MDRKRPLQGDDAPARDGPSRQPTPITLTHRISPPIKKRRLPDQPISELSNEGTSLASNNHVFNSPFNLTKIKDLPNELNKDTVSLKDILGDPLISECWQFNFLHDVDFMMSAFDQDVRDLVKVHIVHGFWKSEGDRNHRKRDLEAQASRFGNVTLHTAFMPEIFGTHHSKMMILLRHDETAQIIIHTANMIAHDWTNMTQAAWISPRLPLMAPAKQQAVPTETPVIGSGERFKVDFLNYLRAYDRRRVTCRPIINELVKYDFSAIRGALIASVPGRHSMDDETPTRWGWAAMKEALKQVPVVTEAGKSEIVVQISSVATLGPTDNWLNNTFFNALSGGKRTPGAGPPLKSLSTKPNFRVMFPTPDEIRKSLDGYESGGSIHMKIGSPQQAKQLQYMKPMFCHWANDSEHGANIGRDVLVKEAGRKRAAAHIKTYIRYRDSVTNKLPNQEVPLIDWALLTSANLSKQAWGDAINGASGEVRVCSYELGVLVWPSLFGENAVMKATFLTDTPTPAQATPLDPFTVSSVARARESDGIANGNGDAAPAASSAVVATPTVGLRVPYNLPIQRYGPNEIPWVADETCMEPDWKDQVWGPDGVHFKWDKF